VLGPAGSARGALSAELPGFRVHVAFPPIGSTFFGAKSAVESWRSGGLKVQTMVALVEGEPADFFMLDVVKGSYDGRHKAPDFRGSR